jgi:preprotein translocase subunit YajC
MKVKCSILFINMFLFLTNSLFAEAEEMVPPPSQGLWQTAIMIGIFFIFFYLILWKPEQKRKKTIEDQRNALKKGDRVAAMGIIGTVLRLNEHTVILKMYDGTKLEFYKAAVTEILPEEESSKKVESISEDL